MCLCNMDGMPKVKIWQILKVLYFDMPQPLGHGMSVKCVQPLDELTVQDCLQFHHLNFKYWKEQANSKNCGPPPGNKFNLGVDKRSR